MKDIDKFEKETSVILSLPETTFADMIVNFLGNKEKINYDRNFYFVVELNSLTQFYYLLDEKIKKEQFTHVNYFSVIISYDDSTNREINTIERLATYHETRNVIPISVSMTWNIVLKFPNSTTIENQKIELLFNITDELIDGNINLTIQHTNPSWGVEVLNLFVGNIQKIKIRENKNIGFIDNILRAKNRFFLRWVQMLLITILAVSLVFSGALTENKTSKYNKEKITLVNEIYNLSYSGVIDNKELFLTINSLNNFSNSQLSNFSKVAPFSTKITPYVKEYINELEGRNYRLFKIFLGVSLFLIILYLFSKYYINSYLNYYKNKSFIKITEEASKKHEIFLESKNKTVFYSLSLMVFSVLCSLIATVIYALVQSQT